MHIGQQLARAHGSTRTTRQGRQKFVPVSKDREHPGRKKRSKTAQASSTCGSKGAWEREAAATRRGAMQQGDFWSWDATHRSRLSSSIEGFFLYFSFAISKGSVLAYSPVDDKRPALLSVLVVTVTVAAKAKAKAKQRRPEMPPQRQCASSGSASSGSAACFHTCVCGFVCQAMYDTRCPTHT